MSRSHSPIRYELFVGVDIAAATASVVWHLPEKKPSQAITIEQTPDGFTLLHRSLVLTAVAPERVLVVMEATGSYWLSLATFLVRQGFVVSVINPAQAHHFAKALLRRAKTDAIDAQTLAQVAALLQPEPWTPPPAIYEELEQRLTQRDALSLMRGQLRNQLHAIQQGPVVVAQVRTRMEALNETLTAHIAEVEAELASVLPAEIADAGSPEAPPEQSWAHSIALLQTLPGIGLLTAMWIVVATMNFTICTSAEQAAAYAGLAPMPYQSGTSVHTRPCIGHTGNGRLRTALYLSTLSAARYNPVIQHFYDRLRAQGKPAKVARCAAARKLMHLAFAVATHQKEFDPNYHSASKVQAAAS